MFFHKAMVLFNPKWKGVAEGGLEEGRGGG